MPSLEPGIGLTPDLEVFYQMCGGMYLYKNTDHPIEIYRPEEFRSANSICLAELSMEEIASALGPEHFSWGWYLFAEYGGADELISINLKEPYTGYCYDCFWESYPDSSRVTAKSFIEFINRVYEAKGVVHIHDLFDFP